MDKDGNLLFSNTIKFFFQNCSSRIKRAIKNAVITETNNGIKTQRKLHLKDINSQDPKLISRIQNNKRSIKKNPYLLTPNTTEDLASALFNKNVQILLWGTEEELYKTLPNIFHKIILDLLEIPDISSKYNVDVNLILMDYAPYAFNHTYHDILKKNNAKLDDFSYGVYPSEIYLHHSSEQKEAINFLYQKCKYEFLAIFYNFAITTNSFTKIDKHMEKDFITPYFIPMIKRYLPQGDSIGLRVHNLIKHDISRSNKLIKQYPNVTVYSEFQKKLISFSTQYAYDIMNLQKEYSSIFINKQEDLRY